MIVFAQPRYRAQIIDLWKSAFGDGDEWIAFYFQRRHRDENMLLLLEDGRVVSMLTMLPFTLRAGGERLAGRYIYAVATRQEHRGEGSSTRLLQYAHAHMRENGVDASVLVPASGRLFDFYQKRGYRTAFRVSRVNVDASEISEGPTGADCRALCAGQMLRIRDIAFGGSGLFAQWDWEALEYEILAAEFRGDPALHFSDGIGEGYAVYERSGGAVTVRELALCRLSRQTALSILHSRVGGAEYRLRLREDRGGANAETVDFGMINWLSRERMPKGEPPYLSLVLD